MTEIVKSASAKLDISAQNAVIGLMYDCSSDIRASFTI